MLLASQGIVFKAENASSRGAQRAKAFNAFEYALSLGLVFLDSWQFLYVVNDNGELPAPKVG
jgi:hypothetical protein